MENPDVVLELERNEEGHVTKMSYKVSNPGKEGHRPLEFSEMAIELLRSEGPEDHSTVAVADFGR